MKTWTPDRAIRRSRVGASWLEVVVVAIITIILFALSLPFVQRMREVTRRRNCDQNLVRLALASQTYSADHRHLPAGTLTFNAVVTLIDDSVPQPPSSSSNPIASVRLGYHQNWISALLPYLDRRGLYESIDFDRSVYHESNRLAREADLAMLRCPATEDAAIDNTTSYAGSTDGDAEPIGTLNDGLLFSDRWVVPERVSDGMGSTILIGEKVSHPSGDLSWMSGTRSSLRNSGHGINRVADHANQLISSDDTTDPWFVGSWSSLHVGGATIVTGDATIEFLSESMDQGLLRQRACRRDSLVAAEATSSTAATEPGDSRPIR
ncbi:MAG: DUF1559 domain-containing protein [Planctomycetota bacterium]